MKKQVLLFVLMLMPLMASAGVYNCSEVLHSKKFVVKEETPRKFSYRVESFVGSFYEGIDVEVDYDAIIAAIGATAKTLAINAEASDGTRLNGVRGKTDGWYNSDGMPLLWENKPYYYVQDNTNALPIGKYFFVGGYPGHTTEPAEYTGKIVYTNTDTGAEAYVYITLAYVEAPFSYYLFDDNTQTAIVVSGHKAHSGAGTIPASVTNDGKTYTIVAIGERAFQNATGLTSVSIPSTVTSIGDNAFDGCGNLTSVTVAWTTPIAINSTVFPNSGNATLHVPSGSESAYALADYWKDFKAIVEPIVFADNAVETLCLANWDVDGDGVLYKDEAAAVTNLGSVFMNNTNITSFDELQYFTGLTSINDSAFYYCSNLSSIIIPNNVNTIGNRAFYVCSGLKSLQLSANVTSIEDRAFAYCSGLESIVVDTGNTVYDSRDNCNALIESSSNTLLVGCKNTKIPSSVKIIAEGAFRGCTELASIEIPEGVTTIGESAFRGCTSLTSVTLPSTITSIGNYAFSAVDEVYNLTSVTVGMMTPVAITSQVFPNRANSTLFVPKGSRAAYKAANYWKEFKNIVELDNGIPVKCEMPTITLLANGKVKVESATEGAICITNITASNAKPLSDGEISLNTPLIVYTVTSYATKEGYDDSEVATATFRYEKTEGDMNGDGMLNITDVIHLVNMILGQ